MRQKDLRRQEPVIGLASDGTTAKRRIGSPNNSPTKSLNIRSADPINTLVVCEYTTAAVEFKNISAKLIQLETEAQFAAEYYDFGNDNDNNDASLLNVTHDLDVILYLEKSQGQSQKEVDQLCAAWLAHEDVRDKVPLLRLLALQEPPRFRLSGP